MLSLPNTTLPAPSARQHLDIPTTMEILSSQSKPPVATSSDSDVWKMDRQSNLKVLSNVQSQGSPSDGRRKCDARQGSTRPRSRSSQRSGDTTLASDAFSTSQRLTRRASQSSRQEPNWSRVLSQKELGKKQEKDLYLQHVPVRN